MMMELDSLPPLLLQTMNAHEERLLFKHVLEYAVLLAVSTKDKSSFQKYISSLQPYYLLLRRFWLA